MVGKVVKIAKTGHGLKEAAKACNAVPIEAFTVELKRQINEHFDIAHAARNGRNK